MRLKIVFVALIATIATLVLNPGLAAYAKQVFTGDNIIDGSLTGDDVANQSLTGTDIANGSLTSADLAPGAGSGGGPQAEVLTWTAVIPSPAALEPGGWAHFDSQNLISASSSVQGVDLQVTGLTEATCPGGFNVQVRLPGGDAVAARDVSYQENVYDVTHLRAASTPPGAGQKLAVEFACWTADYSGLLFPPVTVTSTFAVSALPTQATGTFS